VRPILALLTIAITLSACARTETPEEARNAAQSTQAEFDRLAAEARSDDSEEEAIAGGTSPGQIDTSGTVNLTPGSWSIGEIDGERTALFGEEGETPRVTIACEIGGGIDVRLLNMAPQGGSQTIYISSPEGGSTFTASEAVGDTTAAYISVPSADPFIGRLISGTGPFSLRMGGDQRLAFPADDVLTSIVSACDRRAPSTSPATIEATTAATDEDAE
jgi:hypothetical protein